MKTKCLALYLSAFFSATAFAGPADYVYTPTVEYGEREIDLKFGSAKDGAGVKTQASSIGFGYGATENWFTEIYLKYKKNDAGSAHLDALEWENKFQLTETGKYPVDVGFLVEIERPLRNGEPAMELKFGPLLQTEIGKLQLNGNLVFERKYKGADEDDTVQHNTEMGYQWQVKYRWKPSFEFGLQGFGEMGKWNEMDPSVQQKHQFGPAIFGKIALENHRAIKYNAAWLVGTSPAAPDSTFRTQIEYEF